MQHALASRPRSIPPTDPTSIRPRSDMDPGRFGRGGTSGLNLGGRRADDTGSARMDAVQVGGVMAGWTGYVVADSCATSGWRGSLMKVVSLVASSRRFR